MAPELVLKCYLFLQYEYMSMVNAVIGIVCPVVHLLSWLTRTKGGPDCASYVDVSQSNQRNTKTLLNWLLIGFLLLWLQYSILTMELEMSKMRILGGIIL